MTASNEPDIPADSPLRAFPKRDLPRSLAATEPHGHISGRPRSAAGQRALERRAAAALRAMDGPQIARAYAEAAGRINALLDADRRRHEELDREVAKLTAQRELERKIYWRQRAEKAARVKGEESAEGEGGEGGVVKEEGD